MKAGGWGMGVAVGDIDNDGVEEGSIGADFRDFKNDGMLDLYYTNSSYRTNQLAMNNGGGSFTYEENSVGPGERSRRA